MNGRIGDGVGSGRLTIAPGLLVGTPGGWAKDRLAEVIHASDTVDIHVTRLIPPWFNVAVPIRGAGGQLVACMSVFALPRVTRTFTLAGFSIRKHLTWLDRGIR